MTKKRAVASKVRRKSVSSSKKIRSTGTVSTRSKKGNSSAWIRSGYGDVLKALSKE